MTPVDLDALEALAGRLHDLRPYMEPNPDGTLITDAVAELSTLRALKARVEGAPTGEVMELGDDNEGQPRVLIYSTEAELRKGASLLFKRVALVGLND